MSAWIMGIVGAIVRTTLIDVIMAEGQTKKYVKGIASILVLAAIIAPLPTIFKGEALDFNISSTDKNEGFEYNEEYLNRVYMERYKAYELNIQTRLKEQGLDSVIVRINLSYNSGLVEIFNVFVDKTNMVITADNPNIDINMTIINTIKRVVYIDQSKIVIVG